MKAISSPLDFVGLNVYTADYVRADSSPAGYAIEKRPTSYPGTWRPRGSTSIPKRCTGRFEIPAISGSPRSCTSPKMAVPRTM